ncbi:MAG: Rieske (2Fe-2S) protein, partial [Pseudomonadota bacterium]
VWKRLHYLAYLAYAALVGHVVLGILQDQRNHALTVLFLGLAFLVVALHLVVWLLERAEADAKGGAWTHVSSTKDLREGFAKIALLPTGDRVAIFLHEGKVSAISNACAHQNGPLGEGRIVDCLVTCPWHGFQYDVRTGRSPAPFTERIPTYNLRLRGDLIEVHTDPNPPGTPVDPLTLPEGAA